MKLTKEEYQQMTTEASPKSQVVRDCIWAFCVGGGICLLGEVLKYFYCKWGLTLTDAGTLTSATLIALSAICTMFGWYQKLATKAGAGTLVPITGFANAVVSPAIEFKTEGYITGVGAKMFVIAGPVIVYGMLASVAWGIIWYFWRILFA
ncbi:MAG: stage V sporulation protein AC [Oscillospiraceae bacterium]|nr:stage V sporulation protein AC [Oscillospiraceae bacterium]